MSESLLSPHGAAKSTRLDAAHDLMSGSSGDEPTPWLALAGRDPAFAAEQLDRQTSELLVYVQRQNEELDTRQAELNAKLAQLDNELRSARLRSGLDGGVDLLGAHGLEISDGEDEARSSSSPASGSSVKVSAQDSESTSFNGDEVPEFEEVRQLVAQIMGAPKTAHTGPDVEEAGTPKASRPLPSQERDVAHREVVAPISSLDSFPDLLKDSHLGHLRADVTTRSMVSPFKGSSLESERRLFADRKLELDRREAVLTRMQDETHALHKESLQMRYVTEQLWAELSGKVSADQINELLVSLRARLDEHYAAQEMILEQRKEEFERVQHKVEAKQEEVREQSRKLQEWVESRHDEIKAYAAEVDARELLLDQREHRIRDEISKWEAQRSTYQEQIQGLIKQLNRSGIGT